MRKTEFARQRFSSGRTPAAGTGLLADAKKDLPAPASRPPCHDSAAQLAAIHRSHAVIEFDLDGTILFANRNFLEVMGYQLDEIKRRHHSLFVDEETRRGPGYKEFWERLNRGQAQAGEFRRIARNGSEVWLQAWYNPVLDARRKPFKVVTLAANITPAKDVFRLMAGHIEKLGRGEIPPRLEGNCCGDWAALKDSVNACIDGLSGLVEAQAVLQRLAVNDYTGKVEGRYQGIYAEVARGVNDTRARLLSTLDAVKWLAAGDIGRLEPFRKLGRQSEQDQLIPTLASLIETLESVLGETDGLAQAVASGNLGARAQVNRQAGDFRKIVDGINRTMELLAEPLKVVSESATTLASSSEELAAVSQQMAGNAEETATQVRLASASSDQISGNMASVSSACNQMRASIREIAKSVNESARVARGAVKAAQAANQTVIKLGESSREIGNVLKVITSIAQQTNLLALNVIRNSSAEPASTGN